MPAILCRNFLVFLRRGVLLATALLPLGLHADDALVVGIFPRYNYTETHKIYAPLTRYLAAELGREVRLETAHDFTAFWEGVVSRRYDLVHFNQYHYVKAHRELNYQVIARNVEFGEDRIAGAIAVRKDSGLTSLAQLRGRQIIFGGGRDAMQGYILTTYLLRRAGLQPGDYRELFALNPPNACIAVYLGQADAGGAGDRVLSLRTVKEKIDAEQMILLGESVAVAHLPWAVKHDLDSDVKRRLQRALLQLNQTGSGKKILESARLTGFAAANDSDYDLSRRIIHEVLNERY